MIRFLQSVARGFAAITNTIKSILFVCIFSGFRPKITEIRSDENVDCVILGNGPSMKESMNELLPFLKGKKVMCTNDFVDSPFFEKIQPNYYIFADPTYWSRHASERSKRLFHRYQEIFARVSWDMVILMPYAARKWNYFIDIPARNPHIQLCLINTVEVPCFRKMQFWLYRKNLSMVPMQNVLAAAIFVVLNLGFKKVYLLGADHSWHESLIIDEKNDLYLVNKRFQDTKDATRSPFMVDPAEKEKYDMHKLFRDLSRMFLGYKELEEYAKSIGAKVYNATSHSYIDAFERTDVLKAHDQ